MTAADGPVAVITGAARGMGAHTARRLAARGVTVALLDRPHDAAEAWAGLPEPYRPATAEDLEKAVDACEGRGEAHVADVRDGAAVQRAVDDVADRHGRLDLVVAAAGALTGGPPLWETSTEVWDAMLGVNLTGVFHLAHAAVPHLLAAPTPRHGRLVAVASAAAHHGLPGLAAYTAAKHGVAGLVRAMAAELGPTGVTANAVAPGSTRTPMLEASAAVYAVEGPEAFAGQSRIQRLVEPDEVAATIEWLCLDAPAALTGTVIDVDGGFRP
jgi:SDR family mycofactocin-dependent oxidoreductase